MSKVFLEIDRLVLRGGGLSTSGPAFSRLLEREIARILAEQTVLKGIQSAEATHTAASINVARHTHDAGIARSVAQTICSSVTAKKGQHA